MLWMDSQVAATLEAEDKDCMMESACGRMVSGKKRRERQQPFEKEAISHASKRSVRQPCLGLPWLQQSGGHLRAQQAQF